MSDYNQYKNFRPESMTDKWKAAGGSEQVTAAKETIEDQKRASSLGLSGNQYQLYMHLLKHGSKEDAQALLDTLKPKEEVGQNKWPSTKEGWDRMKMTDAITYFSPEARQAERAARKRFDVYYTPSRQQPQ